MPLSPVIVWLRVAALLAAGGLVLAAWYSTPVSTLDPQQISAWLAPHRTAWYGLPVVVVAFVTLGLIMVPVLLLIAATGIAFGPLLGPIYAMAGCLASASTGFAIGRWMGLRRVERIGGDRISRVTRALKRNGTLAVFLVRKVPAPFTLTNIVVGASTVRFRDFIVGTVLGMGAFVIALAGFGYQLTQACAETLAGGIRGRGAVHRRAADAGPGDQSRAAATEDRIVMGAAERVARATEPAAPPAILQPGRNCWRVDRAVASTACRTPPTTSAWSVRRCSPRAGPCSCSAGTRRPM